MKSRVIQGSLSLGGGLFVLVALLWLGTRSPNLAAAYSPPDASAAIPLANFHLWGINEIFSCPDGSVQFIEMRTDFTGQEFLQGHELRATSGAQTRSFFFPGNGPSYTLTPKSLLIATAGFGTLPGGVNPDFTLTSSLIFTNGAAGSVSLIGANTLAYSAGQLPLDGLNSLGQGGVVATNSPTNFAGQTGSVSCPPAPDLTLTKTAQASGIVEAGDVLTYTIVAANGGTAVATNTLITDAVPLNTTYVPNSASDGGIFGSGVISWANLTISQGTTLTRTFQVTIGAAITTGDRITNTAYISSAQGQAVAASVTVTAGEEINKKTYLPLIRKNS
ncbi:MAG: DUF11 domain-containing protein [Anaerolineae bacterium]|nr:DUF11 domain-containing protein [Anaerolineae bacterium]